MKEIREHAEEIQTNTAMFASEIHKEKEGGTGNTDTQNNRTEDRGSLQRHIALASPGLGMPPTDTNPQFGCRQSGAGAGVWLGWEVHVYPE